MDKVVLASMELGEQTRVHSFMREMWERASQQRKKTEPKHRRREIQCRRQCPNESIRPLKATHHMKFHSFVMHCIWFNIPRNLFNCMLQKNGFDLFQIRKTTGYDRIESDSRKKKRWQKNVNFMDARINVARKINEDYFWIERYRFVKNSFPSYFNFAHPKKNASKNFAEKSE